MTRFESIIDECKKLKNEMGRISANFIMRKFQVTYKYALVIMTFINQS